MALVFNDGTPAPESLLIETFPALRLRDGKNVQAREITRQNPVRRFGLWHSICRLAKATLKDLGFTEMIAGSHHILKKPGCGIINLQPAGTEAKGYQVRQVRRVLREAGLL